ncbi:hypothetical protein AB0B10_26005 [Micromonospora arborensis]|uniref:hypothetical protein n=1 Tax=Micromonospora arborensis TaxID=2116518 RepID=UPI0033FA5DAA
MDQPATTDLDAVVRSIVNAPLPPAVLAAGICTAIGNQLATYAAYEDSAGIRARAAGETEKAISHEGTGRAYTRAATQMCDVARRLTARPAAPGRWQAALAATPASYRELIRDLTDDEGAALAQCGVPFEQILRFGQLWEAHIWPELVKDLDGRVDAHGGTVPARTAQELPASRPQLATAPSVDEPPAASTPGHVDERAVQDARVALA